MFHTRDHPAADLLTLAPGVALARARAHEAAGPSRHLFALLTGGAMVGPILWLRPAWGVERLNGDGMRAFLDPGRVVFCAARGAQDILWAAEEALRSGVAPLVVIELAAPPALTPVRRLHLAAEVGAEHGAAPIALILTPEQGGAPGVETRWHLAPLPGWAPSDWGLETDARWRLTRTRARAAPEATWRMRVEAGRMHLAPLSG